MRSFVLLAGILSGVGVAQEPALTELAYEVVAIRPNLSGPGNVSVSSNNDTFVATNVELKTLLLQAYGFQIEQQLANLPSWTKGKRYDVNAKMDANTVEQLKVLKPEERRLAENKMVLGILVDRFSLKAHHELRDLSEYALVQAKGGSKLKPADPTSPKATGMSTHNGKMEAYSVELRQFMYVLSFQLHRPVVDRTGLTGKFDIALEWTRDDVANSSADGNTEKAPGLLTALQEQLGLKLEAIKGPVDVIVIDHLEGPTEN